MSFVVREYRTTDADAFEALCGRALGGRYSREAVAWKLARPAPAPTRWVAEAGGALIGHYAVIPVRFRIADREVLVIASADAVTDPAWRRRGVMAALILACGEAWHEVAAFEIAVLSRTWGTIRKRVGWHEPAQAVWMRRPLAPFGRVASRVGLPTDGPWRALDRGFRVAAATVVGGGDDDHGIAFRAATATDVEDVWARVAGRWPVTPVGDAAWMAWRLGDPRGQSRCLAIDLDGCPVGVVGVRVADARARDGFIVDAYVDPAAPLGAILRGAAESLATGGATAASALAIPGSTWHAALVEAGFRPLRRRFDIGLIAHQGLPSTPIEAWWFTGAVSDVL